MKGSKGRQASFLAERIRKCELKLGLQIARIFLLLSIAVVFGSPLYAGITLVIHGFYDPVANKWALLAACFFLVIFAAVGVALFFGLKRSRFLLISDEMEDKVLTSFSNFIEDKVGKIIDDASSRRLYRKKMSKESTRKVLDVEIVGGHGWDDKKGASCLLFLNDNEVVLANVDDMETNRILIDDVIGVDVYGPGKVTSDAGMVGGGFGIEGAMKGVAIATVVNILTTHSSVKTFIRIATKASEVTLFTSDIEPEDARIYLSSVYIKIGMRAEAVKKERVNGVACISSQLAELHKLREVGALSEHEFEQAKRKVLD